MSPSIRSPEPQAPAQRDVRGLPKAQLHLHLTGAMRPATLDELADRYDIAVPSPLPATGTWADFQDRYDTARQAIRTPADVARVIAEAAADDVADGCGWLEIQVDPTSYAPVFGGLETFQTDPHWRDLILFHEYFHGDNGAGLGASHQTGWTGSVATVLRIAG